MYAVHGTEMLGPKFQQSIEDTSGLRSNHLQPSYPTLHYWLNCERIMADIQTEEIHHS